MERRRYGHNGPPLKEDKFHLPQTPPPHENGYDNTFQTSRTMPVSGYRSFGMAPYEYDTMEYDRNDNYIHHNNYNHPSGFRSYHETYIDNPNHYTNDINHMGNLDHNRYGNNGFRNIPSYQPVIYDSNNYLQTNRDGISSLPTFNDMNNTNNNNNTGRFTQFRSDYSNKKTGFSSSRTQPPSHFTPNRFKPNHGVTNGNTNKKNNNNNNNNNNQNKKKRKNKKKKNKNKKNNQNRSEPFVASRSEPGGNHSRYSVQSSHHDTIRKKYRYPRRNIVTRSSYPILLTIPSYIKSNSNSNNNKNKLSKENENNKTEEKSVEIIQFDTIINNANRDENSKLSEEKEISELKECIKAVFGNNKIQKKFGEHNKDIQCEYDKLKQNISVKLNFSAEKYQNEAFKLSFEYKNKKIELRKGEPFSILGKIIEVKNHFPIKFFFTPTSNMSIPLLRQDIIEQLKYLEDLSQQTKGTLSQIWIEKKPTKNNQSAQWAVYINFANPKAQKVLIEKKQMFLCNQNVEFQEQKPFAIDPDKYLKELMRSNPDIDQSTTMSSELSQLKSFDFVPNNFNNTVFAQRFPRTITHVNENNEENNNLVSNNSDSDTNNNIKDKDNTSVFIQPPVITVIQENNENEKNDNSNNNNKVFSLKTTENNNNTNNSIEKMNDNVLISNSIDNEENKLNTIKYNENDDKKFPSLWDLDDVADWLTNTVKLPQYIDIFKENEMKGKFVLQLTRNVLTNELGIKKLGHAMQIQNEIDLLNNIEATHNTNNKKNEF